MRFQLLVLTERKETVRDAVLGRNLKNDRMISVCFQGKPFNITVIQVYAPTSNAEEAEVERFYEDLQDLLELTPKKEANSLPLNACSLQSDPLLPRHCSWGHISSVSWVTPIQDPIPRFRYPSILGDPNQTLNLRSHVQYPG